jgi:hypothetical protein
MQSTSTIFILFHPPHLPSPLPLVITPRENLFYTPVLNFLKCILVIQGDFTLILHTCLYCILIRLTPFINYPFSITLIPYYSIIFCTCHYTIIMHRYNVFWLYSLSVISFPLSPPCSPSPLRQIHYYNHVLSLSLSFSTWKEDVTVV